MKKLWAVRFRKKTSRIAESFTESISFDFRLWQYVIQGSIAHARMLAKQRIIDKKDSLKIIKAVAALRVRLPRGHLLPDRPLVTRNLQHAFARDPFTDGDELALLPPLAGG